MLCLVVLDRILRQAISGLRMRQKLVRRVTETKVGRWGVILLLQVALLLTALMPAQAMMSHVQNGKPSGDRHASGMAMDGMIHSAASGPSDCAGHHHHALSEAAHSRHCSTHHEHGPDCCMSDGCVQLPLMADLRVSAVYGKRLLAATHYHRPAFGLPPGEAAIPALPPPRTLS
ncbi:hypothetical protein A0U92_06540 [Acetobacter aceti]|uniref:DUF2946 domain-containing protein n=1 Tax=Acetobacter aceti TaxID=435 RepID=A0A1U9KFA1_ACEAC|nr:hypothetical protein A0U92_06540 [Acetobacter aceti]